MRGYVCAGGSAMTAVAGVVSASSAAGALILCSCHVILSKSGYIFVNVNLLQCEKKSQRRESSQPNYIYAPV